ncbi:Protein SPEAR1 [Linum perenne]
MGSSYFGEPNMSGNERRNSTSGTSSSSSSSRKGKKNNNNINGIINSEKQQPKQPQRGLGVAQLEKIRLTGQLGYNHHHHHHPSYHITPNYPSILNQVSISITTVTKLYYCYKVLVLPERSPYIYRYILTN